MAIKTNLSKEAPPSNFNAIMSNFVAANKCKTQRC